MTSIDVVADHVSDDDEAPGEAATPRASLNLGSIIEKYAILIAWVAVIAVFWIWKPDTFGTLTNLQNVLGSQSALLVLTLGLLISLSAGEFDLSIGAAFSVGASVLVWLDVDQGWPIALSVLVVLAVGAVIGTCNALISVRLGVPSIVATLGMSTLLGGLLLGVTGPKIRSGLDSGLVDLVRTKRIGLPGSFWLALVLTIIVWYILQHTPLGRHLLFVGKGREVARLSGVRVDAIRFGSLVASSMLGALGGMILAGTSASAQIGVGSGYLLPAFAAAFLGATAIIPGQFNAWGSWVAVYFLLTGITGLSMVGYAGWPEQVFYGGALLTAVVLSQLATRARGRAALRSA
jgi:ribose transport system permease protein|tara:strand:+ start:5452 stop:6495 length:1044 start_codon:yes stop_codon:yes gene_type:complete